jgi:hypothetical protein
MGVWEEGVLKMDRILTDIRRDTRNTLGSYKTYNTLLTDY